MPSVATIPQAAPPAYPVDETTTANALFYANPSDAEEADGTEARMATVDVTLSGGESFGDAAVTAAIQAEIDAAFPTTASESIIWGNRPSVTQVAADRALVTASARVVDTSTRVTYNAVNASTYQYVDANGDTQSVGLSDVYYAPGAVDGLGNDLYAAAAAAASPEFFNSKAEAEGPTTSEGPYVSFDQALRNAGLL